MNMDWAALMQSFHKAKVLVVGDICLDRWCRYDPKQSLPSVETGINRIGVVETVVTPGAGGTVANNLASLGAGKVSVLGAIGQDGFGFELERALSRRGIDYHYLVATPQMQTFTYSKVINGQTDLEDKPRFDFINSRPLPSEVEDQLIVNFSAAYKSFDAIVVADQAETELGGVVTPALREVIADVAERNPGKVIVADSRNRIHEFRNCIAKPNHAEARVASQRLFGEVDFARLRQALGDKPLVVTRGGEGVTLVTPTDEKHIPAIPVGDPVDICGAGDSFAAGLALALTSGAEIENAVRFGVMVSSVTVMKRGTGEATPPEVLAAADASYSDR
jgi:rfaE bifunctional protein kinase chain/domain